MHALFHLYSRVYLTALGMPLPEEKTVRGGGAEVQEKPQAIPRRTLLDRVGAVATTVRRTLLEVDRDTNPDYPLDRWTMF
jgi:hypothetical protein